MSISSISHNTLDQAAKRIDLQLHEMSKGELYVPSPGVLGADGYVHLPIRIADYHNEPNYNPSFRQRLRDKVASSDDQRAQWVSMSRDNYIAYWAKDEDSNFLSDVREPAQGRVEWLRHQLRLNDHWRTSGQMKALASSPWIAFY
jgi:hypothetical protein